MSHSLTLYHLLLAASIVLAAYTFRGVAGFGSAFPLTVVVPFINVLDVSASLFHGWRHRKYTQWRELLPLLPFTAVGVGMALYLLNNTDTSMLVHALGVFILVFAVYSLIGPEFKQRCSRKWVSLAGFFGGSIGTLFGTGGPFYVVYLQLRGLPKGMFRSTIATIFLIDGGMRFTGYAISGFYTRDTVVWIAAAIPVMAIGLFIGGRIHTGITQRQFQRAIGVLLVVSGVVLIMK
jgi:uncharacterized membrane protein YfcA